MLACPSRWQLGRSNMGNPLELRRGAPSCIMGGVFSAVWGWTGPDFGASRRAPTSVFVRPHFTVSPLVDKPSLSANAAPPWAESSMAACVCVKRVRGNRRREEAQRKEKKKKRSEAGSHAEKIRCKWLPRFQGCDIFA